MNGSTCNVYFKKRVHNEIFAQPSLAAASWKWMIAATDSPGEKRIRCKAVLFFFQLPTTVVVGSELMMTRSTIFSNNNIGTDDSDLKLHLGAPARTLGLCPTKQLREYTRHWKPLASRMRGKW